ncbi:MAG: tetratricopeptide repeat protein, partial [Abditibacteriaceae bacterium]
DALAGRVRLIASTGNLEMAIDEASARIAKVRKDHGESNARNLFAARANIFITSKRYDEALLDFNQAIASDSMPGLNLYSQHADWYYNRAFLWSQKHDDVHALADYNVATKLNPAYIEKLKGTRFEKVLSPHDPDKSVLINNGDTAILHKLMGNEWISAGSLENAIGEFDKAIALDPNYADAFINRGLAQMNLKNLEAAERDMNKAISLKATDPRYFINRSTLHLHQQRAADAVVDAKKATELDGKNAEFWNALATAQELNGEYAAAETSLNTELPLIENKDEARRVRGHIVLARALQNIAPTKDDQEKVISRMSRDQRKSLLDATEASITLHPEITALGELRAVIVATIDRVNKQPMFIP